MSYIPRSLENRLKTMLRTFPAVMVYGPRQCGKSTLVRHLLPSWHHLDLERPSDLGFLTADLEGFFESHPRGVVIDEAQRLPEVFPVLRHVIDRKAGSGRFVLTGSASPQLVRSVSETLAGRIGLVELTPFLASELAGTLHAERRWFWGGYPPIHRLRGNRARMEWLDSYVTTYLERDLSLLGIRLPPQRLRALWTMLTHVHGNLLNVADLARSLGVSSHTVSSHLDALESTFMIRRLPPYHANIQKRLAKSPKVYIRDSGLLHFLAGLRRPQDLATWPRRGSSFEGLVIEELAAIAAEKMIRPGVFFWRTQAGAEVDLLLVHGREVLPVEVRLGVAVNRYDVAGLRQCMKDLGLRRGWIVTTGKERRRIASDVEIVPWEAVRLGEFAFWQ